MSNTCQALSIVHGELGSEVSEAEFNDWFEEHAAARLTVPGICSAARYIASDSKPPSWFAIYDLAALDVLESEPYKALRSNVPPNEQSIISRLSILHPTIYSLFSSLPNSDVSSGSPSAKYILAVGIEPPNAEVEEDQNRWYAEEHLDLLSKVPGFLRARRFKLVRHVEIAGKAEGDPVKPTKYLTLYDWDRDPIAATEESQNTLETPWSARIHSAVPAQLRTYILDKTISK